MCLSVLCLAPWGREEGAAVEMVDSALCLVPWGRGEGMEVEEREKEKERVVAELVVEMLDSGLAIGMLAAAGSSIRQPGSDRSPHSSPLPQPPSSAASARHSQQQRHPHSQQQEWSSPSASWPAP